MALRRFITSIACAGLVSSQLTTLDVSINADEITTGTPLDGFVSYSIEFSSFPEFAGKTRLHEC